MTGKGLLNYHDEEKGKTKAKIQLPIQLEKASNETTLQAQRIFEFYFEYSRG